MNPSHNTIWGGFFTLPSKFKDSGTVLLNINPEIIEKELTSETENYFDIGKVVVKQIEDYWE